MRASFFLIPVFAFLMTGMTFAILPDAPLAPNDAVFVLSRHAELPEFSVAGETNADDLADLSTSRKITNTESRLSRDLKVQRVFARSV